MVSGPRPYLYLTCGSRLCLRCSFSPILKDAPGFSHTASFPAQRARVHSVPRIVTPQPTVARLIKAATLAAPSGPSSAPVLCELAPLLPHYNCTFPSSCLSSCFCCLFLRIPWLFSLLCLLEVPSSPHLLIFFVYTATLGLLF